MNCNCKQDWLNLRFIRLQMEIPTQDSADFVDLQIERNIAESIYTPLTKWKQPALCSYLNL